MSFEGFEIVDNPIKFRATYMYPWAAALHEDLVNERQPILFWIGRMVVSKYLKITRFALKVICIELF